MTDIQLTIPLHYEGDFDENGNEVVTRLLAKDMPGGEIHRTVAAEQSLDGFVSTVEIVDVFHGNTVVHKNGDEFDKGATFIRFKFGFMKERFTPSRLFRHATVTLTFEDQLQRAGLEPEIDSISPSTSVVANVTPVVNEAIQSFDAKHSGVGFAIQHRTTTESKAMATMKGRIKWGGNRCYGSRNRVIWIIEENPAVKDGISDSYEAGLLLFREPDNSRFVMKAEVSVYVDKRHRVLGLLERWRGKQSEDEPVTFDPSTQLGQQTDELEAICSSLPEYMEKYSQGFLSAERNSPSTT